MVRYHQDHNLIHCLICGSVLGKEKKKYHELPVQEGEQGFGTPNIISRSGVIENRVLLEADAKPDGVAYTEQGDHPSQGSLQLGDQ